jgi:hypothetical protein
MPGLMEEVKKKINRPVPDLPLSDDTDILQSKPRPPPLANGNGNGNGTRRHAHGPANPACPARVVSLERERGPFST